MTPFRDFEADFYALGELMLAMIDSRAESQMLPGMEWLNDIQTLSIKLFKQLGSVMNLSAGCAFESRTGKSVEFIDYGSMFILTRASLENFLTLHWIFSGPVDQCIFRHKLWQYAGLADRLAFTANTDEGKAKKAQALVQHTQLALEIEASPFFAEYKPNQQKELRKGNWRVGWSWGQEAVRAGFHKTYFDDIYSHLCGYSHSNYISAMQIGQSTSLDDQLQLARGSLQMCIHTMTHFVHLYASTFSPATEILNASECKEVYDTWYFRAENMEKVYKASEVENEGEGEASAEPQL